MTTDARSPLAYAPDATAEYDHEAGGYRAGGDVLSPAELRDRGFARESNSSLDSAWVQANGFQVRGLIRRGDAQRFSDAELRDLVTGFLAERGVEVERPDDLEAFCFNYTPDLNLDEARLRARADRADTGTAGPLMLHVLAAQCRHADNAEALRRDYDAERARVDKLTGALVSIASSLADLDGPGGM